MSAEKPARNTRGNPRKWFRATENHAKELLKRHGSKERPREVVSAVISKAVIDKLPIPRERKEKARKLVLEREKLMLLKKQAVETGEITAGLAAPLLANAAKTIDSLSPQRQRQFTGLKKSIITKEREAKSPKTLTIKMPERAMDGMIRLNAMELRNALGKEARKYFRVAKKRIQKRMKRREES